MSNSEASIRAKLYDFIRFADNKKVNALYHLLEDDIEDTANWWENKDFVHELDDRYRKLESGEDAGMSLKQLESSINSLRKKKYG